MLTIEIESIISTIRSAFFFLYSYEANGIRVADWFRLEKVALKYGDRYFFRCRDTGKRVSAMYFVNGRFGSRYAHDLTYSVCKEHRQFYENHRRFERYFTKWRHLVWDTPMYLRRSNRQSALEKAYGEKADKYVNLMVEDTDRQVSKYEDEIRRRTEASERRKRYLTSLNKSRISI